MSSRFARVLPPAMIAVVACALLAAAAPARHAVSVAEAGAAPAAFPSTGTIPVVAEHRYRMAAKVRILLFWVGRDNVGGARIRWRRGEDGAYGYDLLIGSDPARAPRQINRWGFILEESHGTDASVVGLMKRTDEDSLDEAKSNVATEASHGIDFKMITAHSDGRESTATVTVTRVPRDFSYRELEPLTDLLSKSAGVTRVRTVALPAGATAGLLCGVAELLHDAVAAVARDRHAPKPRAVPFAYYGKQYDLTRTSAEILTNATYEDVTYPRLIQVQFTVRARGGSSAESFVIVSGVDGALAEIPVFVSYQPKWWFRVDMVLDSRERF